MDNTALLKRRVFAFYLIAFLIPPGAWLFSAWYFKIWTTAEMFDIILRPNMPVYVIIWLTLIFTYLRKELKNLQLYIDNQEDTKHIENAQQTVARLPKTFMFLLPTYIFIGNFIVSFPREFIDTTEFILALLNGIPIVFLTSIPFYLQMNKNLEQLTVNLPLSDTYKAMTLGLKMDILFLLGIISVIVIFGTSTLGIIHNLDVDSDKLSGVLLSRYALAAFVVFILSFFNLRMFKLQIMRPVKTMKNIMALIAEGKGDLTLRLKVQSKDEIGEMSIYFNRFIENISKIIIQMRSTMSKVNEVSEKVSQDLEEMANRAEIQAEASLTTSDIMTQLSAGINHNSTKITESNAVAGQTISSMQLMVESSEKSIRDVENISKRVNIVSDIAFQTDILSLNASIQASKAGESGAGFAVVAAEIQKLAEKSKEAAAEIDDLSKTTIDSTHEALKLLHLLVSELKHSSDLIKSVDATEQEQMNEIQKANESLNTLNNLIQQNSVSAFILTEHAGGLLKEIKDLQDLVSEFIVE